jgi:hypothetical protein
MQILLLVPANLSSKELPGKLLLLGPALAQIMDSDHIWYGSSEMRHYFSDNQFGSLLSLEIFNNGGYFAAGLFFDFRIISKLCGTISLAPGLMTGEAKKRLGHIVEFRSTFELNYQFTKRNRIGISIGHYSNSSLGKSNPGTESLKLILSFPVSQQNK